MQFRCQECRIPDIHPPGKIYRRRDPFENKGLGGIVKLFHLSNQRDVIVRGNYVPDVNRGGLVMNRVHNLR